MLGGKCVKRMYEKGVKGYVHHIGGPPGLKMQLPADERRGRERPPAFSPAFSRFPRLFAPPGPPVPTAEIAPRIHPDLPRSRSSKPAVGLKQPYLVFQVLLPLGQHVSLEVVVADAEGTRRRLLLSTSFTDVKTSPLHCQVPLPTPLVPTARWLNLVLDLPALVHALFNAEFRSTEGVGVGATCRLRKIFTMRSPPIEHGVDRAVEDEAARIKGTGFGMDAGQTGGELGINGFGFGPGDASNGAGSRDNGAYGSAVPEPVPRAADFLPGVDRATLLLDPHKLMACRVALPRAYTGGERGSSREGRGVEREGGGGSRAGRRRGEDRGESNRGQPGGKPPLQLLRTHERAQAVVEWRVTRRVTGQRRRSARLWLTRRSSVHPPVEEQEQADVAARHRVGPIEPDAGRTPLTVTGRNPGRVRYTERAVQRGPGELLRRARPRAVQRVHRQTEQAQLDGPRYRVGRG